ncbi:MAG: hypothetical protein U1C52_02230 [Patescibacteria group bacterium]|nr:hypothetical protein [Patescibacteria group bacterium]
MEPVTVVYKPRTKQKKVLGKAIITDKKAVYFGDISQSEAIEDGFPQGIGEMQDWFVHTYGSRETFHMAMNKLTLAWIDDNTKFELVKDEVKDD